MPETDQNPYVGAQPFEYKDRELFFGREREAFDLLSLVISDRLVLFYAQSGAGKSSLINTRLIPGLESEREFRILPIGRLRRDEAIESRSDNVYICNLLTSLSKQEEIDEGVFARLSLSDYLKHVDYVNGGYFYNEKSNGNIFTRDKSESLKYVLIMDQFEELFTTYQEEWQKRDDFFKQIAAAMKNFPRLWIVLVMREDYIANLDPYVYLLPGGLRTRYYMQRLSTDRAIEAVEGPAKVRGRKYANGAAKLIVDALSRVNVRGPDNEEKTRPGQYIEPVHLQVVCSSLWEKWEKDNDKVVEISTDFVEKHIRDINQSLGNFYEKRLQAVARSKKAEEKNVTERDIREWFERELIIDGKRRNMVAQQIGGKSGGLDDSVVREFLGSLVREEERSGGAKFYELTHDRMVEPIIENNKEWDEKNRSPFHRQAAAWKESNEDAIHLLNDAALDQANRWVEENQGKSKEDRIQLTDTELKFLEDSRKKQKEKEQEEEKDFQIRSAKRAKGISIVATIFGVLAIIAFGVASRQAIIARKSAQEAQVQKASADNFSSTAQASEIVMKEQRDIARSESLSTKALGLLENNSPASILLGVEAYTTKKSQQSQATVLTLLQHFLNINFIYSTTPPEEAQFSPDGKIILVREKDGFTLWDADNLKPLNDAPFNGHFSPVTSLAISPEGEVFATGGEDGSITLWNMETHQPIGKPLAGHTDLVWGLAFTPDGTKLASGSEDNTVILWDVATMAKIGRPLQGHTAGIVSIAFSPDGKILASGSVDNTVILWDVETHEPVWLPPEHTDQVWGVAFSRDGKFLATGGRDETIILWDVEERQTIGEPLAKHTGAVRCVAFSPDGKILASGSYDGTVILWNVETQKQIGQPLVHEDRVYSLAFSPDGKTLASGTSGNEVNLWNVNTHKLIGEPLSGYKDKVYGVEFSPDGKTLASVSRDTTAVLWDVSIINNAKKLGPPLKGHPGEITGTSFSEDGRTIISYGNDGVVLLDVVSQSLTDPLNTEMINLSERVAAYQIIDENSGESSIGLWDLTSGKPLREPFSGEFLALSQDGKILVYYSTNDAAEERPIIVQNTLTGKQIDNALEGEFIALTPSGDYLIFKAENDEGDSLLNVWDTEKEDAHVLPLIGFNPSLSPDGNTLVYQTSNNAGSPLINLLDIKSGGIVGEPVVGMVESYCQDSNFLSYSATDDAGKTFYNVLDISTNNTIVESIDGNNCMLSPDGKFLIVQGIERDKYNPYKDHYFFNVRDVTRKNPDILSFEGEYNRSKMAGTRFVIQISDHVTIQNKIILLRTEDFPVTLWETEGQFIDLVQDGNILIYTAGDAGESRIILLDTERLALIDAIKGEFLAVSPEGKNLIVHSGGAIQILDISGSLTLGSPIVWNGNDETEIKTISLSPDGKKLALSDNSDDILILSSDSNKIIGVPFNPHKGAITIAGQFAMFSSDGRTLAVGNYDTNTVTLWDASTLKQIGTDIPGDFATFSPDGRTLAVGNYDTNTVTLWDASTQKQIGTDIPGYSASFSPDGKTLTVGNFDTITVTLWEVSTQKQIGTDIPGYFTSFSPDGKTLAVGNYDTNTVTLWEVSTQKQIGTDIPGDSATFSPDGRTLAVGNYDTNTVALWDASTQKPIGTDIPGYSTSFSSDGRTLAVGNYDTDTVTLWEVSTQKQIGTDIPGDSASFSLDGKTLAVGNYDTNTVTLWEVSIEDRKISPELRQTKGNVTALTFNPNGRFLMSTGEDGIILSNVATQEKIIGPLSGENAIFSPEGGLLAISNGVDTTSLWNISQDIPTERQIPGIDPVFSPDGQIIATKNNENISITLLNLITDENLGVYPGSIYGNEIIFSQDGKRVDSGPINGNEIIFSQDGKRIVTIWTKPGPDQNSQSGGGDENTRTATPEPFSPIGITLWDVNPEFVTKREEDQLPISFCESTQSDCIRAAFSSDNKYLAYVVAGELFLWDIDNHKLIGDPFGVSNELSDMAFIPDIPDIPDSSFLALQDRSNRTTILVIPSLEMFGEPIQGSLKLEDLSSHGGNYLIENNGSWSIWEFNPVSWIDQLCLKVGRNFYRAEWEFYFTGEDYRKTCKQWPLESETPISSIP